MTRQPGSERSMQWLLDRVDSLEAKVEIRKDWEIHCRDGLGELRREFDDFRSRAYLALFALGVGLIGVLIAIRIGG